MGQGLGSEGAYRCGYWKNLLEASSVWQSQCQLNPRWTHCWPISPPVMVVTLLGWHSQEGEKPNWAAAGKERSENTRENSSADPKLSEGCAGDVSGAEEIPLQAMIMTMVGQVCPCSPWRSNLSTAPGGFHTRAGIPEGHFDPMSNSRGRTCGPVERAAHAGGEELLAQWGSHAGALCSWRNVSMGGIHAEASNEEL